MANEQNVLGNRHWSATAVRTAIVLIAIAIVLIVVGGLTETFGIAIVGAVALGAAVIVGIVGVVGSGLRR